MDKNLILRVLAIKDHEGLSNFAISREAGMHHGTVFLFLHGNSVSKETINLLRKWVEMKEKS